MVKGYETHKNKGLAMKFTTILASAGLFISSHAIAGLSPVAIIEDIQADTSTVSFMDYVNEGQIIQLGATGKLIIGYLNSCRRETITGGTVTIGLLQSSVNKGQLLREDVECDGGNAKLSGQQSVSSGAFAVRSAAQAKIGIGKSELTIYGRSPVIRLKQINSNITIERMDKRSRQYTYQLKGKYIDLANKNLSLALGGVYRVSVENGISKTFKVDKYAEAGKISILSRLINL